MMLHFKSMYAVISLFLYRTINELSLANFLHIKKEPCTACITLLIGSVLFCFFRLITALACAV